MDSTLKDNSNDNKDFAVSSYLAGQGELESIHFGSNSEPVYYQRVGDLMVSTVLH